MEAGASPELVTWQLPASTPRSRERTLPARTNAHGADQAAGSGGAATTPRQQRPSQPAAGPTGRVISFSLPPPMSPIQEPLQHQSPQFLGPRTCAEETPAADLPGEVRVGAANGRVLGGDQSRETFDDVEGRSTLGGFAGDASKTAGATGGEAGSSAGDSVGGKMGAGADSLDPARLFEADLLEDGDRQGTGGLEGGEKSSQSKAS
jgi:hypothetical protein